MEIEEKLDSMIKRYEKQNRGLGCLAPLPIGINDLKELKQSLPPEQEITEQQALNKLAERFPMTTDQIVSTLEMKVAHIEQKKVEVPELIDAWIKHVKGLCWGLFELLNPSYSSSNMAIDVEKWLESDKLNTELLAKAWFADDYIVVKEPLYYVHFGFDMYLIKGKSKLSDGTDHYWMERWDEIQQNGLEKLAQFTEETIKSIDKNYWLFKVPVKEEAE